MDIRELFTGISDAEFNREHMLVMHDVVSEIYGRLRGYEDLSPTNIRHKPNVSVGEDMLRIACVRQLADNGIIYWNPDEESDEHVDYVVTVVNRYKFEELYLQLNGHTKEEVHKSLPSLAYYNPLTSRGFLNGNALDLRRSGIHKSKQLFELLLASAPKPVPRERLTAVFRLGTKSSTSSALVLNEAFVNLRKRCHVKADVIDLQNSGVLNAIVMPFDKVPESYIFPE